MSNLPLNVNNPAPDREENFDAIAPRHSAPMLISTTNQKGGFGKAGWLFFLLFLIAVAGLGFMYVQLQAAADKIAELERNPQGLEQRSREDLTLLERVAKHIVLPAGQPKVADASQAPGSLPSYVQVKDGDQLITYPEMELVYNPSSDVIVYVRPLSGASAASESGQQVAGAETKADQGTVTVDVRNGSGVSGLAAKTAETVKTISGFQVGAIGNAAKNTYNTTILVNLSGKNIAGLEKQFKTTAITSLPVGESATTADVLVIVGKQQM